MLRYCILKLQILCFRRKYRVKEHPEEWKELEHMLYYSEANFHKRVAPALLESRCFFSLSAYLCSALRSIGIISIATPPPMRAVIS